MNIQTQRDIRAQQLFDLGLRFNGSDYLKGDFNVHWTEVTCDTDQEFNEKLSDIKAEMERRQKGPK